MAAAISPPHPPLADDVVTLRPPDERDLDAIERGINDPDVVRWFGPSPLSAAEVLELNRRRWIDGTGPTFSVCQADDACLGHAWVNLGGSGRGTIGYWLLPGGRGRGLATRAVRLVTRWCFEALGLARVAILAEPSNRASVRVAERSGFRFEGVLRSNDEIGGRRVDNAVFSMLPGEMGT